MKLWLLKQDQNSEYDTYDSLVVCAETEEDAAQIRPDDISWDEMKDGGKYAGYGNYGTWAYSLDKVRVTLIGEAEPSVPHGVVLGSFNAG